MVHRSTRRDFIKTTAPLALAATTLGPNGWAGAEEIAPPRRAITRGPKHHWFGYYDKLEFDPSGRYVLGMEVEFEHRTPRADDVIKIGMVDLHDADRWIELGETSAWGWQQGCMLQWVPGSNSKILWNGRGEEDYNCHVLDVKTGESKTIPHPIYTLATDGATAVAADFRRIQDVRPGYGYVGFPDPHSDDLAPDNTGIFRVNLDTGKRDLVITLAQIAALGRIPNEQPEIKHYFNHLLFNPDGSRFIFLHRWRYPDGKRLTRMLTANPDGSDVRIVDDNGLTSHFIWRDPTTILAFSEQPDGGRGFYLFEDASGGKVEEVGGEVMKRDGHCSYLPGGEWILNDTYPDRDRNQTPFLFHVETERIVKLGDFHCPKEYTGEWRCDTHPRFSPDGESVVIDAPHEGTGRQLHLIDISGIVG